MIQDRWHLEKRYAELQQLVEDLLPRLPCRFVTKDKEFVSRYIDEYYFPKVLGWGDEKIRALESALDIPIPFEFRLFLKYLGNFNRFLHYDDKVPEDIEEYKSVRRRLIEVIKNDSMKAIPVDCETQRSIVEAICFSYDYGEPSYFVLEKGNGRCPVFEVVDQYTDQRLRDKLTTALRVSYGEFEEVVAESWDYLSEHVKKLIDRWSWQNEYYKSEGELIFFNKQQIITLNMCHFPDNILTLPHDDFIIDISHDQFNKIKEIFGEERFVGMELNS